MVTLTTVIHVITCLLLILVVLLQSGKGAEISASFGGSSQTVFGSTGGANFFTRFTAGLAVVFMFTSIGLTLMKGNKESVFDKVMNNPSSPVEKAPATPPVTGNPAPEKTPAAPVK